MEIEYAYIQTLLARPKGPEEKLDSLIYRKERRHRKHKRTALAVVGLSAAAFGLSATVAGAVIVSMSAGMFAPIAGIGAAIGIAAAGELALAFGPTIGLFGASGAIYERFRMDAAMKKFIRSHYPEQLIAEEYTIHSRTRNLDFKTRYDMIASWADDFSIDIDHEEFIWYACKDNFTRFLQLRPLIATKSDRKMLKKMMCYERKDLLWAQTVETLRPPLPLAPP